MSQTPKTYSLLADVGGTNTRVALADGTHVLTGSIQRFRNTEHATLEGVLTLYLADKKDITCIAAAVDLAGPVRNGVGQLTNLDWTIDEPSLTRATGAQKVAVLNDMQAQGHSVGHLGEGAVRSVVEVGPVDAMADKLVINVGTGFNASPIYELPSGRLVPPSECGHANMPIRTQNELRLMQFVETAHGFPAIEDVLSGRGLERIYAWLGTEDGSGGALSAAEIAAACATRNDPKAEAAGRRFVQLLGTVAGNLSLIHLPFGGVYLVGGVVRAFEPFLIEFGFLEAFRDKGRFAGLMAEFPVSLIEDDYAALVGLAHHLCYKS